MPNYKDKKSFQRLLLRVRIIKVLNKFFCFWICDLQYILIKTTLPDRCICIALRKFLCLNSRTKFLCFHPKNLFISGIRHAESKSAFKAGCPSNITFETLEEFLPRLQAILQPFSFSNTKIVVNLYAVICLNKIFLFFLLWKFTKQLMCMTKSSLF